MDKETLKLYDPANAKNLTQEQLNDMQNFTDDDLRTLAEMFPNKSSGNAFLVLGDKNAKQQIGQRSTYHNLYNLRVKNKRTNFYALSFTSIYRQQPPKQTTAKLADLTGKEIKSRPGIAGRQAEKLIPSAAKASEQVAKVKDETVLPPELLAEELLNEGAQDETNFPDLSGEALQHNEKIEEEKKGKGKNKL